MVEVIVGVDPNGTSANLVGNVNSLVDIIGVDASSKTVLSIIGKLDNTSTFLNLGNGHNGAKNLLLDNLHVFGDVSENGGVHKVTLTVNALATSDNLSTTPDTVLNVLKDTVELDL